MNRNHEYEQFKSAIVEPSIEDLIDQAEDSTIFRILDDHGVPKQEGDPRELLKIFWQAGEIQSWELMDGLNAGPGTSMMNDYSTHETWGSKTASQQRYCEFYLATDGKWYMMLAPNEYGEWQDAEAYGPYGSQEDAERALDRHSNPGGYNTDDSGTQPPPGKARQAKQAGTFPEEVEIGTLQSGDRILLWSEDGHSYRKGRILSTDWQPGIVVVDFEGYGKEEVDSGVLVEKQ